jgi:hypothetical protein
MVAVSWAWSRSHSHGNSVDAPSVQSMVSTAGEIRRFEIVATIRFNHASFNRATPTLTVQPEHRQWRVRVEPPRTSTVQIMFQFEVQLFDVESGLPIWKSDLEVEVTW